MGYCYMPFFVTALNRSYLSKCVGQINTVDKVRKKMSIN